MPQLLRAFLATTIAFILIDAVWISTVANEFYADQIGSLMRQDVRWEGAVAFYIQYLIGVQILVIAPVLKSDPALGWKTVFWRGAVLGALCYGTYDLTNYAVLEGWPLLVTLVDLVWGTLLTASISLAGYWAAVRSPRNPAAA